ncbi:MAG: hypothetical protein ACYS26_22720 [Planctomycetota bacterium]|jgi:predicted Zn-dependent protease
MEFARRGRFLALALLGAACLAAAPQEQAPDAWSAALDAARADVAERGPWLALLASEPLDYDRQVAANGWAFELAQAGDIATAAEVQRVLHERLDAEWTVTNLAVSLTRLGRLGDTRAVLYDFLERYPRSGTSWNYLGQAELGAGRLGAARAAWARAVVCGSDGATVSLARLALDAGQIDSARAGFRVGADRRPPGPWSLRGWGLTCLPGSLEP